MLKGRIHSFETFGAVDGPGIRFIVFFQGCPLRCKYCHNPDSWDANDGTEYTSDEIVAKVLDYLPFYRNGGGVTFSGGEPMMQHEFALELIEKLKAHGVHTAIDTSGGVPLSVCRAAVEKADMLLLDIKSLDPETSLDITGNSSVLKNEIEFLDYCESVGKPVWIRHVVVPGLTLDTDKLQELSDFLAKYSCVKRIEPLAFHKLGEHKWMPEQNYSLKSTPLPTPEEMKSVDKILKKI